MKPGLFAHLSLSLGVLFIFLGCFFLLSRKQCPSTASHFPASSMENLFLSFKCERPCEGPRWGSSCDGQQLSGNWVAGWEGAALWGRTIAAPALGFSPRPHMLFTLRTYTTFICNERFLLFLIWNLRQFAFWVIREAFHLLCLLKKEWIITCGKFSTSLT